MASEVIGMAKPYGAVKVRLSTYRAIFSPSYPTTLPWMESYGLAGVSLRKPSAPCVQRRQMIGGSRFTSWSSTHRRTKAPLKNECNSCAPLYLKQTASSEL